MKGRIIRGIVSVTMACVLFFAMGVPALASAAPSGNLVQNPGFEEGLDGWTFSDSDDVELWEPDGYSEDKYGNYGLLLISLLSRNGYATAEQTVSVPRSGCYQLDVDVVTGIGYPEEISVNLIVDGKTYTAVHPEGFDDGEINECTLSIPFTVEEATTVQIVLGTNYNAIAIFDNVSLVRAMNTVINGSFESGFRNWTQVGPDTSFITETQALDGRKSLYLGYFINEGLESYIKQDMDVERSGPFTISLTGSILPEPSLIGLGGVFIIEARDKNGALLRSASNAPISDSSKGWQQAKVLLEVPAGTATITVKIGGLYCTGAFYVDNVFLTLV